MKTKQISQAGSKQTGKGKNVNANSKENSATSSKLHSDLMRARGDKPSKEEVRDICSEYTVEKLLQIANENINIDIKDSLCQFQLKERNPNPVNIPLTVIPPVSDPEPKKANIPIDESNLKMMNQMIKKDTKNEHNHLDLIQEEEKKLMLKAKELENEMNQLKQQKINAVVQQFREQMINDAESEKRNKQKEIEEEYKKKMDEIMNQKDSKMKEINELKEKLITNIDFMNVVLVDLDKKVKDINACHGACIEYMKKEKEESVNSIKQNIQKHIDARTKIFENYVASKY